MIYLLCHDTHVQLQNKQNFYQLKFRYTAERYAILQVTFTFSHFADAFIQSDLQLGTWLHANY